MNQLSFSFMENYVDEGIILNKLGKFNTKICSCCKKEFEATIENFGKSKTRKGGLHLYCKNCNNLKTTTFKNKNRKNNKCLMCPKQKLPNHSCCAYHACYTVITTQQRYGRFKNLKGELKKQVVKNLLTKLENQNHKCALTGEPIEFGLNISLDHIVSIKQGGTDELENLQWVTLKANQSKGAKN